MTLIITSYAVLLIVAGYFAYRNRVTDNKLQDYIAKYESVKNYAETVASKQVAVVEPTPTPAKEKPKKVSQPTVATTTKHVAKAAPLPVAPTRRGRKPKMI